MFGQKKQRLFSKVLKLLRFHKFQNNYKLRPTLEESETKKKHLHKILIFN